MLITPFKIQVCRGRQLRILFQYRRMGHPGVEPNIEDVVFLLKTGTATIRTDRSRRKQLCGFPLKPDVRTMLPEQFRNMIHGWTIR